MDVKAKLKPTTSKKSPDAVCKKWRSNEDNDKNHERESTESLSSCAMSMGEGDMQPNSSQSLRESSECSLESLNQDLPAHMQLVPFSSKSASKKAQKNAEKAEPTQDMSGTNGKVKSVIKNLCTPQAVPTPRKAETNYDMEELVDSLPKLKVTTPARIHDESRGAFSMFATPPKTLVAPVAQKPVFVDRGFSVMNPVDIDPIYNPFETEEDENKLQIGSKISVHDDIFSKYPVNSDSVKKSCGKALLKPPFDLKAGTLLFTAQRSLFSEVCTEKTQLSDSLINNVGTPAGVVFPEEQFSPNLSFITTSPSNDSESSFIMPSQNTDCDYLIRRISYDPTMDNMANVSDRSSNGSEGGTTYNSRVNVPTPIEELRESPDKISPLKKVDKAQAEEKMYSEEYSKDNIVKELLTPEADMNINSANFDKKSDIAVPDIPMISSVNRQTYSETTTSASDANGPRSMPLKSPRFQVTSKPPWTPSGRVRYTTGPYSQIKLSQERTPVRKIEFGRATPVSAKSKRSTTTQGGIEGFVGGTTPRSEGKSHIPVPRAKLPVYRRGTPHRKNTSGKSAGSPVSSKKPKTLPKFRLVDRNAPSPRPTTGKILY